MHGIYKGVESLDGNKYDSAVSIISKEDEHYRCNICGELFQRGYLVDNKTYCSSCFIDDVKSFITSYKAKKERRK